MTEEQTTPATSAIEIPVDAVPEIELTPTAMLKNFSAKSLGINGRQSELLELALTYAFDGFDIDMHELFRRSQRTDTNDATKYLSSARRAYEQKAKPLHWGTFDLGVNMDADETSFTSQVGALHPVAELAQEVGMTRAVVAIPAATDRLPYHEYFEAQRARITQVMEVLTPRSIRLGLMLQSGKELAEGKQFEFVRNVEGFKALVDATEDSVGFVIDSWDWVVGDGAMDQLSEIKADQIVAVRLAGLPDDADTTTARSTQRVLPSIGGTPDPVKLIAHLASIGYDGPVSPGAAAEQYKGQTREAIVKDAQESFDAIFRAAGLETTPLPMDLIEDIPYETSTSIT
ncbi:MAG: TIM barrel protein [Planctomycetota bacterium]